MKKTKIAVLILLIIFSLVFSGKKMDVPHTDQNTVPKIVVVMEKTTERLQDLDKVVQEINNYIRPVIGAEIEMIFIKDDAYTKTLNYMFSANEQVDAVGVGRLGVKVVGGVLD